MVVILHVTVGVELAPDLATILGAWRWRPDVLTVLVGLGAVYVSGWLRLRRRHPASAPGPELLAHLAGLLVIGLALLSPIDALAPRLLAMHMIQHELLTMVATPLLLLANPYRATLWALPAGLRRRVGEVVVRDTVVRRVLSAMTFMPVACGTFPWPTRRLFAASRSTNSSICPSSALPCSSGGR